jgi:sugar lactone lactonase YvrE/predicted amidohydrolase
MFSQLLALTLALAVPPAVPDGAKLEKVWGDGAFTEGPAYGPDGRIYFSDIGNRIMAYDPRTGRTAVYREPSGRANGLDFDPQGRLVAAEGANTGGNRRITITEKDGTVRVLADRWQGKRFNSPNDLTIDTQGRVYFTDPRYTGNDPREIATESVYRVDPDGKVTQIITDVQKPNGIILSPDMKTLFVADSNRAGNQHLLAYPLKPDGSVGPKRLVYDFGKGGRGIDGMCVDVGGLIYAAAGRVADGNAGVWVFDPVGKKLAVIPTPEDPTNCVFGGPDRTTLYVTAGKSLYRIAMGVEGFAVYWPSIVTVPSRTARDGWTLFAVRDEIAPRSWQTPEGDLALAGRGDEAVDGRWQRTVPVTAGRYYTFRADYRAKQVATPERSALARVVWLDASGKQVAQPEYPVTSPHAATSGATTLTGTYQAPERSVQAKLELHLRWAPQGEVVWHNPRLDENAAPTPRKVRLAAVNHRPRNKSPEQNLEAFARLIDEAAKQKADVVCLPEGITVCGTGKKYADVAEPIPGPSTRILGESAKKHGVYVVAGIYEREGTAIYNTSILLGRDGSLGGKYRKVCLPREEIDGGITPGKEYPVFDTDFGRVGMMICWDVHFPEVARGLAQRGAEVILMPIWGGNQTLAQARAIENQLYLVASGYDFPTTIYDKKGHAVAAARSDPEVIVTEVDLNERLLWQWLGDWRARIWREGPP